MLRIFIMGLIVFLNFVLQTTLFPYVAILGVVPQTSILLIVSYAILRGDVEGAVLGFCIGFLQDVVFMDYLGLFALLFGLTGFVCGKPFKDFFKDSFMLPVILAFFAMIGYEIVFYFIHFMMQGRLVDYFRIIILPGTIYTMLLAIPMYHIVFFVNKRLERYEKRVRRIF